MTTDGDHGRIEVRRHAVSHDIRWLLSDLRFPGKWRLEDLAMIAMVEAETAHDGRATLERRCHVSSATLSPAQFAAAARALARREPPPPGVDVVFHDDLMRPRTDHGPANMAVVRHIGLEIIRAIDDKASLAVRRQTIGWDDDDLFHALARPMA